MNKAVHIKRRSPFIRTSPLVLQYSVDISPCGNEGYCAFYALFDELAGKLVRLVDGAGKKMCAGSAASAAVELGPAVVAGAYGRNAC